MKRKEYTLAELTALSHTDIYKLAIHDYGKLLRVQKRRKLTEKEQLLFIKQNLMIKLYKSVEEIVAFKV